MHAWWVIMGHRDSVGHVVLSMRLSGDAEKAPHRHSYCGTLGSGRDVLPRSWGRGIRAVVVKVKCVRRPQVHTPPRGNRCTTGYATTDKLLCSPPWGSMARD
jgi:hypothetical protein